MTWKDRGRRKKKRLPGRGTFWLQRRAEEGEQETEARGASGPSGRGSHKEMRAAPRHPFETKEFALGKGVELIGAKGQQG